jgi:SulP family sulfate permease
VDCKGIQGAGSDVAVIRSAFFLTVLIGRTVAIEMGIVLAVLLFMRKMIKFCHGSVLTKDIDDIGNRNDKEAIGNFVIPEEVEVFEINGPLFFRATYKFKDATKFIEGLPKVLIMEIR